MHQLIGGDECFWNRCSLLERNWRWYVNNMIFMDFCEVSIATSRQQSHDTSICDLVCCRINQVTRTFKANNVSHAFWWWVFALRLQQICSVSSCGLDFYENFSCWIIFRDFAALDGQALRSHSVFMCHIFHHSWHPIAYCHARERPVYISKVPVSGLDESFHEQHFI